MVSLACFTKSSKKKNSGSLTNYECRVATCAPALRIWQPDDAALGLPKDAERRGKNRGARVATCGARQSELATGRCLAWGKPNRC